MSEKPKKHKGTFLYVAVCIFGLFCLVGLMISVAVFVRNQIMFNRAYTEAAATIAGLSLSDQETAEMLLDHMERLQELQKNAATNDVMSFLYSTVTTVLVALGAGFVAKSYENVKKAKKSADKTKDSLAVAVKSSTEAKTEAENSKKTMEVSLKAFREESGNLKTELAAAENEYKAAKAEVLRQMKNVSIIEIHIEILHAKAALEAEDKITANERIYKIGQMVEQITEDSEKRFVKQLQEELLRLKNPVEDFEIRAGAVTKAGERESRMQAVKRYKETIDTSVEFCTHILDK